MVFTSPPPFLFVFFSPPSFSESLELDEEEEEEERIRDEPDGCDRCGSGSWNYDDDGDRRCAMCGRLVD